MIGTNAYDKALDQLIGYGLEVDHLDTTGTLQRVRHAEDKPGKKDGWYVAHEKRSNDGEPIIFGTFGWWKDPTSPHKLKYSTSGMSAAKKGEIKRAQAAAREQVEQARKAKAVDAAKRAAEIWPKLPEEGSSPYLQRKKVRAWGVRFSRGSIVVPMEDMSGQLRGLQFIDPEGQKRFLTGTAKQGAFCWIPGDDAVICVAEGYATAATIRQATGYSCAVAFDAGNLMPVCKALRQRLPAAKIVICGDDDYATEGNPGREKGDKAAKAVNGMAVYPVFAGERGTDWNDLHVAEGLEVVKSQIESALLPQARQRPEGVEAPFVDGWEDKLVRKNDYVMPCQRNIELILDNDKRWDGVLGFSEFVNDIWKHKPPPIRGGQPGIWTDFDIASFRSWLSAEYKIEPGEGDIIKALLVHSRERAFHPVRDYLGRLEWDKVKRAENWVMTYLGADDKGDDDRCQYLQKAGFKWLLAAVARAHAENTPDKRGLVHVRNVLILEGKQRAGKSTALRYLGDPWFSDSHVDMQHKDGQEMLRGLWIVEMAELSAFNKADSNAAKRFLSLSEDRYRASYGRKAEDWARQCVFAGTTNDEKYLKDPTGNERYWPIPCGQIDLKAIQRDKDQIWAEVMHHYREGVTWWVLPEESHLFEREQDERFQSDAWEEVIGGWLHEEMGGKGPTLRKDAFYTLADIFQGALAMDPGNMRPPEQQRVGQIMRRMGWRPKRRGSKSARRNGYVPPVEMLSEEYFA